MELIKQEDGVRDGTDSKLNTRTLLFRGVDVSKRSKTAICIVIQVYEYLKSCSVIMKQSVYSYGRHPRATSKKFACLIIISTKP
jgi:hypothetical protein